MAAFVASSSSIRMLPPAAAPLSLPLPTAAPADSSPDAAEPLLRCWAPARTDRGTNGRTDGRIDIQAETDSQRPVVGRARAAQLPVVSLHRNCPLLRRTVAPVAQGRVSNLFVPCSTHTQTLVRPSHPGPHLAAAAGVYSSAPPPAPHTHPRHQTAPAACCWGPSGPPCCRRRPQHPLHSTGRQVSTCTCTCMSVHCIVAFASALASTSPALWQAAGGWGQAGWLGSRTWEPGC